MKLDVLAFGAHPDDVEISAAGTILSLTDKGLKAGIVDLTRGEMGTRGTAEIRDKESADAAKILGLSVRENLGFDDGFIHNKKKYQLEVIKIIRKFKPRIVITTAIKDRHPDHANASALVEDSCFLSGLMKIETDIDGEKQTAWRPKLVLHFIQALTIEPDVIIDTTEYFERKMKSILAHQSQFYNPDSKEPQTFISSPHFLEFIKSRDVIFGSQIGAAYGEGFTCKRTIGVKNLTDLI